MGINLESRETGEAPPKLGSLGKTLLSFSVHVREFQVVVDLERERLGGHEIDQLSAGKHDSVGRGKGLGGTEGNVEDMLGLDLLGMPMLCQHDLSHEVRTTKVKSCCSYVAVHVLRGLHIEQHAHSYTCSTSMSGSGQGALVSPGIH